jgi:hypothetical protein
LLSSSDLTYIGAFRVPDGHFGSSSNAVFQYGGTALAFSLANNSLFLVGHDWGQLVAEISIPPLVNSATLSALNTAVVLQAFADVTDGHMADICSGNPSPSCVNGVYQNTVKVGGLLVSGNVLYGTVFAYYDGSGDQDKAHFYSSTTLANSSDFRGFYPLANIPQTGYVSGFLTSIPTEWQGVLGGNALTGQCCIPITGRTSLGPAAFALNLSDLGMNTPVPDTPLVYYTLTQPTLGAWNSTWNGTTILYNGSTVIKGGVWPSGTRSILYFGRQGTGPFCYGGGDTCGDPTDSSKGTHAYPYQYEVWAYDANDLVAVRQGLKSPWVVKPYALWTFELPFSGGTSMRLGGAAYDPQTNRIYLSQLCTDGGNGGSSCLPVIHVLQVGPGGKAPTAAPPAAPTQLQVH